MVTKSWHFDLGGHKMRPASEAVAANMFSLAIYKIAYIISPLCNVKSVHKYNRYTKISFPRLFLGYFEAVARSNGG